MLLRVAIPFICAGLAASAWANDDGVSTEAQFPTNTRQLTFEGKRAGEGYFSADGGRMVFQSEREADNPFYQIYLMDLELGDVRRISPGYGKTTCAWIHPTEARVLFASTHDDPDARKKQDDELAFRASGQERRYAWDYDEHFELYEFDFDGKPIRQLTDAAGYDAEGSWSPDGKHIAFASNRKAYSAPMNEADTKAFELDKSFMMDIYIMDADGSNLRQLTDVKGYDGGPFFSPDGTKITWRRFSENGATAEVFTMNIDGSEQKQLTEIGAMSWAPYFHPSGDYLIFTTNVHGFANFELYLVDAAGDRDPVRVTNTDGFDGLPVFSPDGSRLAWTSNRTPTKESQIFLANWDDAAARTALGLDGFGLDAFAMPEVALEGAPDPATTEAAITTGDLKTHIEFLASEQLQGRRTGTEGELKSVTYIADVFEHIGLAPAGDNGTYFQSFEFTAGVKLGEGNQLRLVSGAHPVAFAADTEWRPLAFSKNGRADASEIVFAGYGIKAPKSAEFDEYDSFVHLDVTDKWVLVFRYAPEDISPQMNQHFAAHSSLRYKAMTVRDLGARGLIVASGPNSQVDDQLVPMAFDTSLGGTSVFAVSVTDATAQQMLDYANKDLKTLQDELDSGQPQMGFKIEGLTVESTIAIAQEKAVGRNVLARLNAADRPAESVIVIGAHADHLGVGAGSGSLARSGEQDAIHYGADDNASGVAAMLEIAQRLNTDLRAVRRIDQMPKRDIIFAAWSGEELGLLGAYHFTGTYAGKDPKESLRPEIAAYLNMDMVGRLDKSVIIAGIQSSSVWPSEVERRNVPVGLSITTQNDNYLPTDATAFYLRGVPFLNAFTGAHEDYHSPRDTADKINYDGAQKIATFMSLVARSLVTMEDPPDYLEQAKPENMEMRANLRAYLGTIPDYAESGVPGLKISGVTKGAPAEDAGLKTGDVIVELAGRKIENIYDYTFAIEALKVGEEVNVVVMRDGARVESKITPRSRD